MDGPSSILFHAGSPAAADRASEDLRSVLLVTRRHLTRVVAWVTSLLPAEKKILVCAGPNWRRDVPFDGHCLYRITLSTVSASTQLLQRGQATAEALIFEPWVMLSHGTVFVPLFDLGELPICMALRDALKDTPSSWFHAEPETISGRVVTGNWRISVLFTTDRTLHDLQLRILLPGMGSAVPAMLRWDSKEVKQRAWSLVLKYWYADAPSGPPTWSSSMCISEERERFYKRLLSLPLDIVRSMLVSYFSFEERMQLRLVSRYWRTLVDSTIEEFAIDEEEDDWSTCCNLLSNFPRLRRLEIAASLDRPSGNLLLALIESMTRLQSLTLLDCRLGVAASVVKNLAQLTELSLRSSASSRSVAGDFLVVLTALLSLTLEFPHQKIKDLVIRNPKLTHLSLDFDAVKFAAFPTNLESLWRPSRSSGPFPLRHIRPSLRTLQSVVSTPTVALFRELQSASVLEELDLGEWTLHSNNALPIVNAIAKWIRHAPQLKRLSLPRVYWPEVLPARMVEAEPVAQGLLQLTNLETLATWYIPEEVLGKLTTLRKLRCLTVWAWETLEHVPSLLPTPPHRTSCMDPGFVRWLLSLEHFGLGHYFASFEAGMFTSRDNLPGALKNCWGMLPPEFTSHPELSQFVKGLNIGFYLPLRDDLFDTEAEYNATVSWEEEEEEEEEENDEDEEEDL